MAKFHHSKVTGQPYRLDGKGVIVDKSRNLMSTKLSKTTQMLARGGTYHKPESKGSGSGRGNPNHGSDGRFE